MGFVELVYLFCAVVGGTVLVAQSGLTLLGLSGDSVDDFDLATDTDVDVDVDAEVEADADVNDGVRAGDADLGGQGDSHGANSFFKMLSFRTAVAALTFFGLGGLAAGFSEVDPFLTFVIAMAAGGTALYIVHWMMQSLKRLTTEGNVRIERAVGRLATVYLKVPGQRGGTGKITIELQNRTLEYQAVTADGELPRGSQVVVVDVLGPDTVEVKAAATT